MPDDDDRRDRQKPFQNVTAWVIGLAALIAGVTLLATNSEALWKMLNQVHASNELIPNSPVIPSASASMSTVDPSGSQPTAGATGEVTAPVTSPQSTVFSSGESTIRGTWLFDLDNGVITSVDTASDLWWDQIDDTKRRLQPKNGTQFSLIGERDFSSITLAMLKQLTYSSNEIRGDNDASNAIPASTVLAFKTKSGRYGKMLIVGYGYDLKIKWVTFAL